MFPRTLEIYESHAKNAHLSKESKEICSWISRAQHVHIEYNIWDYAAELALNHYEDSKAENLVEIATPDGGRLFSDSMVATIDVPPGRVRPDHQGGRVCKLFIRQGDVILGILLSERGKPFQTGKHAIMASGFRPGEKGCLRSDLRLMGATPSTMVKEALQDAFLLSVINEERFVQRTEGGNRQQRRHLERAYGFTPIGWHRVTWNIGEAVKAKVAGSDPRNAMPLHFCRAHWRRAQEGQPKAIMRNDVPGWWCWVTECWKGHPAFGTKLHHYSPKLRRAQDNAA